jgi:HlyD family secretion protein
MRNLAILLLVLLLVGGGAGYWYLSAAPKGAAFKTEPVTRGDLLAEISATGTLEPEDVIDVGAQVAGQIKEFGIDTEKSKPIDYGSTVQPGTILAQIDDALYKAKVEQSKARLVSSEKKVDQAKAKVEQAQANLERSVADLENSKAKAVQAQRDWERARRLGTGGAIAASDSDAFQAANNTAQATVKVSEAAITQAKASLADAQAAVGDAIAAVDDARAVLHQDEINLGYCTIKSPVEGVIIDRRVTLGQTVQSSFNTPSLFLIARDLKRMKVWASVNEADIGQVTVGQPVRFTVDARPGMEFAGVVGLIRLNASMTQNVVTYTVEVLTDNTNGKLLPYMTANLHFEVSRRKNVLLVPNAALRWKPQPQQVAPDIREARDRQRKESIAPEKVAAEGKEKGNRGTVWVEAGGFARPIKLKLGHTDGNNTEVLEGELTEGTELVSGETRTTPGEAVTNPFAPQMFGGKKQQ